MSYILDALRKSEQERQRGKVPDIHGAVSDTADAKSKANLWPIITVAVIILNVGILGYFWLARPDSDTPSAPLQSAPLQSAPIQTPAVDQPKQQVKNTSAELPKSVPVAAYSPPKEAARPVQAAPTTIQPQPAPDFDDSDVSPVEQPLPNIGYMPQLEELPAYERDGIPDMTFSSHMYSSMPRFRSIIINGKRLKEGQYLNQELQVREITESGVIMSYGSTLFEVDVLGRWAQ